MKTKQQIKKELKMLVEIATKIEQLMEVDEYYKEQLQNVHDEVTCLAGSAESFLDDLENE